MKIDPEPVWKGFKMTKKSNINLIIFILIIAGILSGCNNLPKNPTSTPTMSEEEMVKAAEGTALAVFNMTQTQDAILHPSATPEPTSTPTPAYTATNPAPAIPPTATEPVRPYLSVGYKSCYVKNISGDQDHITPYDRLYLEVCYTNDGSGTWNQNYFAQVTRNDGGNTSPLSVPLGKNVAPNEKACFSFNQNMAGYELGQHYSTFALTTDGGAILNEGYVSCYWTVY